MEHHGPATQGNALVSELVLGVAVASILSLATYEHLMITFAVGMPLGMTMGWILTRRGDSRSSQSPARQ